LTAIHTRTSCFRILAYRGQQAEKWQAPQVDWTKMFIFSGEAVKAVPVPARFDGNQPELGTAPDAWQHTEEILLELGHDWDRISELKDSGVIP